MLTPRFEITQTDSEIVINVHAPYSNIKETEVYVDGTDFRFFSPPYYLRLKLPGEIEENDLSSGSYDCEKSSYILKFSKVNKGEHFDNLDMITSLLISSKKPSLFSSDIEVIGNPSASLVDTDKSLEDTTKSNQNPVDLGNNSLTHEKKSVKNIILTNYPKYGFANKISKALDAFEAAWIKDMIDLPNPDVTPEVERKILREKRENKNFNEDHYMADLIQLDCAEHVSYAAEWALLEKDEILFTESELDLLKELPNKEYLLEAEDISKLSFNLVDILYASCYNHRTTLGESTVESCWTINKLSSTLCWFQNFTSMDEVIKACIRRSLCYPLYRNWELSMKVFEDVKRVIELGKKYVIKRFCEIHMLFNNSYEPRYLLNELYIKDFIIWLQTSSESWIASIRTTLDDIHPKKENMQLDLLELEIAAYSVSEEGLVIKNSTDEVSALLCELRLDEKKADEEKLSSSSSSSTDSSDTDDETDSGDFITRTNTSSGSTTTTSSVNTPDSDDFSNTESDDLSNDLNDSGSGD